MISGMNESQINETFNTLMEAIRRPAAAVAPIVEAPKTATPEELKDRFDTLSDKFDPAGAVRDLVTQNYGNLISELGQKANEGVYTSLRGVLPDFDKHEQDIRAVLKDTPPDRINQQLITQTFFGVVGAKTVGERLRESQRPPSTKEPSNQRLDANEVALNEEEMAVAKVMFRNSADPIADYKKALKMVDEGSFSVKVPGDK